MGLLLSTVTVGFSFLAEKPSISFSNPRDCGFTGTLDELVESIRGLTIGLADLLVIHWEAVADLHAIHRGVEEDHL